MKPQDTPTFSIIFRTLAVALQLRDPHPDSAMIYFRALSDLPVEAVQEAAVRLARGDIDGKPLHWFPTTAEWHREAVDAMKDARDEQEHERRLALPESTDPNPQLEAIKVRISEIAAAKVMPERQTVPARHLRLVDKLFPREKVVCQDCGITVSDPAHKPDCPKVAVLKG